MTPLSPSFSEPLWKDGMMPKVKNADCYWNASIGWRKGLMQSDSLQRHRRKMQNSRTEAPASFSNADDVQRWAIASILKLGSRVAPRGIGTIELTPFTFTLSNPRRRCTEQPERRWSKA